jgi:hypothetical protein
MPDWHQVKDQDIQAIAYDPASETIYIQFPDGRRRWYEECPVTTWEALTHPDTRIAHYEATVLSHKPSGSFPDAGGHSEGQRVG